MLTGYAHSVVGVAAADEPYMIEKYPVLQPLRHQYAALFTPNTDTIVVICAILPRSHADLQKCLSCLDFMEVRLDFFLDTGSYMLAGQGT